MSDLSEEVANYWKNYSNSNINHTLINFEEIEEGIYTLIEEDELKIYEFIAFIDTQDISQINLDLVFRLFDSLPAAHMFFLLHKINSKDAKVAKLLIDKATENKNTDSVYKRFYDRNTVYERLQLSARIFSSERVNKLILALSE